MLSLPSKILLDILYLMIKEALSKSGRYCLLRSLNLLEQVVFSLYVDGIDVGCIWSLLANGKYI